jgi:hypothetical protein
VRIIQVQLNCSTEQEYYRILGNLLVAQKLLNEYLSTVNDEGIGPEGYAEEWMDNFEVDEVMRDEVLNMFVCALMAIARTEDG